MSGYDKKELNNKDNIKQRHTISYKEKFIRRDKAIKIIKELSDFLRILDLRESDILKTMLVRFAIESVEASVGSLLIYDENTNLLKYQDTYLYENNRIILESFGELLKNVYIRPGEGISGEAYINGFSILVEDINKNNYPKPVICDVMKIDIESVICLPIKVENEVVAILEIGNVKDKPHFNQDDLETVTIIANFASTILENAKHYLWAIHDSLTNLYNNHYFYKELSDEIVKSKRYGRVFSLVVFDLDNFKQINDNYGHSFGDKALQTLADCIKKTIRKEIDIPARYGGDEFVIVFPNTTAEEAKIVCERLLNLVRNTPVKVSDQKQFTFTLSMGIAEFPKDGDEIYYLFNHADEALYKSKRNGKNQVTIYQPDINK